MGQLRGRIAWYLFGQISHKTVALGPFLNMNEAQTAANKIVDWDSGEPPIPESFNTRELQKAKQMYKAKISQSTGQLGLSLRPIRNANNKNTSRFEQIKQSRGIE
jgi:hypothetical protein